MVTVPFTKNNNLCQEEEIIIKAEAPAEGLRTRVINLLSPMVKGNRSPTITAARPVAAGRSLIHQKWTRPRTGIVVLHPVKDKNYAAKKT